MVSNYFLFISGDDSKPLDFVEVLPSEVTDEIFLYLEPKDLGSCTSVSTSWREAVNSNKIWAHFCNLNGWKDDFDPNFSHFYRAHRQFRKWTHSYDSFSPICQKRLLFNKHACLKSNWRYGKYVAHKIRINNQELQLFEPVTCDGRYLVMLEKSHRSKDVKLVVWSLNGVPSKLCNLPLPHKVNAIDSVAFDHGTIAVAQSWLIVVYKLENDTFKKAFEKEDLLHLEPKANLPKEMKRITPHLKITEEFIICVPSHSHSTVDFIPIFFWDSESGELKHTLRFESMYNAISNAEWFGDSCYLSVANKKKKKYQIVEFNVKSAEWESFTQDVTVEIEKLAVSDQYILAITKATSPAPRPMLASRDPNCKELWFWDRATGSALKTIITQGKGFQFVDDFLMYFDSSRVTVMDPKSPGMCSEFEVTGTISSIRPSKQSSIMVIIKTGCYIEVWDWGLGTRLYTVTVETGYGSQLWCDDKRIISYNVSDSLQGGGMLILGFW